MKLATFNMRGGGSRTHWAALASAINPDIFFVQETKNPKNFSANLFDSSEFSRASWEPVSHGKWGASLHVPQGTIHIIPIEGFTGWVTGGVVQLEGLEFLAFSVHLSPTQSSYARTAHRLLDVLRPVIGDRHLVLAGDWNLSISASRSTESLRHKKDAEELHRRIDTEFGLRSAWICAHADEELPQTLRWNRNPLIPFHCDGILLPAAWSAALTRVEVLSGDRWSALSDHNPVVAELNASMVT